MDDRAERLTTERAKQSAELGGVGVRACRVKSREMRWVSVRELMSLCEFGSDIRGIFVNTSVQR